MTSKKDLTHCPVCLEVFITPRALPCLHTFCELCLHEYIRAVASSNRGSNLNEFDCPTCRQKVPSPSSDSWEKWAEQFVLNHMMVSLIDERKTRVPSLYGQLNEKMKALSVKQKEDALSLTIKEPELKPDSWMQSRELTNTETQDPGYGPSHFFPPPPHPENWPPPHHHGQPPHHFFRALPPHHRDTPPFHIDAHQHHRGPPLNHRGPPPHNFPPHHGPRQLHPDEYWSLPLRPPPCHGPRHHRPPGRHGHRGHCRHH